MFRRMSFSWDLSGVFLMSELLEEEDHRDKVPFSLRAGCLSGRLVTVDAAPDVVLRQCSSGSSAGRRLCFPFHAVPFGRSHPARPTHKGWGLCSPSTRAEALHQLFETLLHGFVWSSFSL